MKNKSHLGVKKPAEVCYNMDGVVIMTSSKVTCFSEMPTFTICVTTFACEESRQSAHGNGFQVCYEQRQGQQSKHPSPPQIIKVCPHVKRYLRKLICCVLFAPHTHGLTLNLVQVQKCHRELWASSHNKSTCTSDGDGD